MRIGEVAAGAGVNIQTLRYYERRGLLPRPRRHGSGYREYEPDTIRLVRFIKRAQELGFTLNEIADLIRLRQNDRRRSTQVRALATAKLEDIELKIHRLGAMRQALQVLVEECACEGRAPACPIIEALDDSSEHLVAVGATEK
ncbi:MAG: MerR family transcriptional regulator [Gemmatimonadales bacterium]|nr:MerR family transcriptional regulator [Gemmatimonadales bacterium]